MSVSEASQSRHGWVKTGSTIPENFCSFQSSVGATSSVDLEEIIRIEVIAQGGTPAATRRVREVWVAGGNAGLELRSDAATAGTPLPLVSQFIPLKLYFGPSGMPRGNIHVANTTVGAVDAVITVFY
jgi:hypothetical protein